MRLLQRNSTGQFSLTDDLLGDGIPKYAILSHTWWADAEEVTFEDIINGTGKDKPGYEKIRFCGEQARQDGLLYFWIDTCCIDKRNDAEVSRSINSMFRWYHNATKCYVYLSDVSSLVDASDECNPRLWESDFRKSRWFTRGWTLQELLAPASVEFFSRERKRLSNKSSLIQIICEITNIPHSALQGDSLSQFSVDDRLRWIEHRRTKREEDKAYSLLGIFDVYILPIYGEGTASAFARLLDEFYKVQKCIQDLRLTNPRDDKRRIEETKGGLLEDSYHWILENSDFQRWRDDLQGRLLWIKGDPGKGKTMLLCGIINHLEKSMTTTDHLSYFFCQATDSRINHATAVLRGLVYLLIDRQPSLVSHIRNKYDRTGKILFEDANAWVSLTEILRDILQDPTLNATYLIIDALDECTTDLPKLLDLIVRLLSICSRVKWIVSSRNRPEIEERIERVGHKVTLDLELNEGSIHTAVGIYIGHKVHDLAKTKNYDDKTRDAVFSHLSLHSNGTFLWVALVCQNLEKTPRRKTLTKLNAFPPGLNSLYERMVQQIYNLDDINDTSLCKRILALIAIVYRPITLKELASLTEMLEDMGDDLESLREIIGLCGSFLTMRGDTVYFVHQSAKDFLFKEAFKDIFPSGIEGAHYIIFLRSLKIMSKTLRRDMYSLRALGYPIEQVEQPDPDPLAASRYSCISWIAHLYDSHLDSSVDHRFDLQDGGVVHEFVRKKYLYWLEALSLCKGMSEGVVSMAKLEALIQGKVDASVLIELVRDARRFIMSHKLAIVKSPLQTYVSALLFSPDRSLIRDLFRYEEPKWIAVRPATRDWSACLQTLEGHSKSIRSVAFSHDSTQIASASEDRTVEIWDVSSGACLQTLEGHGGRVESVAFSPHDPTQLASASEDKTIKIWDVSSGVCLQTLEGHSRAVCSVAFSYASPRLASASADKTIKIWDVSSLDVGSSACLQTLQGHSDIVGWVAFLYDSTRLASSSDDDTVKIWDFSSSVCLQTLERCSNVAKSVAFSHDSTRLASVSYDNKVKIWDTSTGNYLQTLEGHSGIVYSVAFSHDSTCLASASDDKNIKIWDTKTGECLQTLGGHNNSVYSVAFSYDSTRLASASDDGTIKIWDVSSWDVSNSSCLQTLESHSDTVNSVTLSHDSTWLASASADGTIKVWDRSGTCLQTLKDYIRGVDLVTFSHDLTRLASASFDETINIWDLSSGMCLQTFEYPSSWVNSITFSYDSTWLASASDDMLVRIWDTNSGDCLQTLKGHSSRVFSVAFSYDSTRLASVSNDKNIKIWDASSKGCLQTLEGHSDGVCSVAFSYDSTRLASASFDKTIKIWDLSSSTCLQTLEVGRAAWNISFDATGSSLQTYYGTVAINASFASFTNAVVTDSKGPQYKGGGLGSNEEWITYNSENVLWLPSDYRPFCASVSKETIAIGVGSGKVWMCNFNFRKD